MEPLIFHIDVNSAYLSWTSTENLRTGAGPDLRLIPAIIGGDQKNRHGVVLAKSIPAKAFGIVTGEPVATAYKKCPTLQMAAPDHHLYHTYSQRLMRLLESFCPYLEQLSIDECFLDMGRRGYAREHAQALAEEIRAEVRKLGFTVNVGISSRKVLAKMASDFQKPDKTHTLFPEEIEEKMWPLPVGELYMAGHSSVATLHMLGILTIGDLARSDRGLIESHLKSHGALLWEYANGIDDRPVITEEPEAKGIGNSTTLAHDVTSRAEAKSTLLALCRSVSGRLKKAGQLAGTVTVEIKYSSFQSVSHQASLLSPSNDEKALYDATCTLFDQLWDEEPIRLLGVRGTRLVREGEPVQMNLFDLDYNSYKKDEKHKKLDAALEAIQKRYGKNAVITANRMKKEN